MWNITVLVPKPTWADEKPLLQIVLCHFFESLSRRRRSSRRQKSRPLVPKRELQHQRSPTTTRQVTSHCTLAPRPAPEPKPLVAGHRPIRLLDRRRCCSVT
ncbi:hypothetical protein TREES_T100006670 [Tupaia chinensis]|uniref:Uncharacterized protein n=1 Tax=Tupaia chinensis TaxID=246437 RepID=L9KMQ8_TUPCH|nr:hypothetical protein TREES_T100006670 [Tupaia chinensis]